MTMQSLKKYKRITVKIGSALLVDRATGLKREWLASLAEDVAALASGGAEILVVSSGAIALGRTILGLGKRALKLEESQAAAAVGQIALAGAWSEELDRKGLKSGQILLTLGDTEERRRYLNARATIGTLLKMSAVPDHQRERHGGDLRDPLRRQRPSGGARRHHDGRRPACSALRHRRALHRAARIRPEGEIPGRRRTHHARDRGDGGRSGFRTVARRHAHQARRRQDRHHRRHGDDHHVGRASEPAHRDRARRAFHPVPAEAARR